MIQGTIAPEFTYEPLPFNIIASIDGISYRKNPQIAISDLSFIKILHYDFHLIEKRGKLICHKDIAKELTEIFYELYQIRYPIDKVRLIDVYNGNDESSMADNNSSCFNYRLVTNQNKLSNHALGKAVDINPLYNPYVQVIDGVTHIMPSNARKYVDRNRKFSHKLTSDDPCVKIFKAHGFTWGGDWSPSKDYQHFEKV